MLETVSFKIVSAHNFSMDLNTTVCTHSHQLYLRNKSLMRSTGLILLLGLHSQRLMSLGMKYMSLSSNTYYRTPWEMNYNTPSLSC